VRLLGWVSCPGFLPAAAPWTQRRSAFVPQQALGRPPLLQIQQAAKPAGGGEQVAVGGEMPAAAAPPPPPAGAAGGQGLEGEEEKRRQASLWTGAAEGYSKWAIEQNMFQVGCRCPRRVAAPVPVPGARLHPGLCMHAAPQLLPLHHWFAIGPALRLPPPAVSYCILDLPACVQQTVGRAEPH
jgi:hypothetical protein